MAERFGQAFWPGVQGFISATYTTGHGISPGIASLEIPEQDVSKILPYGTLVITDGQGAIKLQQCKIQSIDFIRDGERRIVLHIADRRWRWSYGFVTGEWNVVDPYPDPNLFPPGEFVNVRGPYAPGTYRTAGDMMRDCFRAMGEGNFLIDPEPTEPIPAKWEEEVPAQALASICDTLGYRVCPAVSGDGILVASAGFGKALPSELPIISESPGVQFAIRPAKIRLVGAEVIYTDLLRLEPCGMEPDGTIKHINDLSYKPVAGWGTCNPFSFWEAQATNELTVQAARELAAKCIWRMFRIKMVDVATGAGPGPTIGGYGLVRDRKQIKMMPQQYGSTKQVNGQPDTAPPYALGSIYVAKGEGILAAALNALYGNTDATNGGRLPRTPQIDGERGLVTFDRQCYKTQGLATVTFLEPEIYLYTSMTIRSIVGRKPVKFARDGAQSLLPTGCPPEILRHPELQLVYRTIRNNADHAIRVVDDNLADIIPPAEYYLARADSKYQVTAATSRTYAGIFPIELNGAISQVTWRVGGGSPATTTASLNTEHDTYVSPYPERRRRERQIAFGVKDLAIGAAAGGAFGQSMNAPPPGLNEGM